ncbi:MAG: replication initiator protein A, partial [Oscillospiraceae bacterium]|nr:replication initiator protein A [Oscillospiraceae bacterium]
MSFGYFYGSQSESFSFYRIPRELVTGEYFRRLSTDAKLLYGLLLDRMGLSAKNGWLDQHGRVYIYYTVEEIAKDINCGLVKAGKLLA